MITLEAGIAEDGIFEGALTKGSIGTNFERR
jgi:hypothetical protein